MTMQKLFPLRQTDVKCCYRTSLRKCSGKIQAVEELFSLEEMFTLCILEMERALCSLFSLSLPACLGSCTLFNYEVISQ